jgi:hypothetical protein
MTLVALLVGATASAGAAGQRIVRRFAQGQEQILRGRIFLGIAIFTRAGEMAIIGHCGNLGRTVDLVSVVHGARRLTRK